MTFSAAIMLLARRIMVVEHACKLLYVLLKAVSLILEITVMDLLISSGGGGKISRDEVIARAQDWVNRRIPYSQTAQTDGYRQDCSGMVSMAWKSSTAGGGHTTYNMQEICTRIDRSQLQRGDAILDPSEHVLMFDYWVDSDHFMEYAEHDYGQKAQAGRLYGSDGSPDGIETLASVYEHRELSKSREKEEKPAFQFPGWENLLGDDDMSQGDNASKAEESAEEVN
eukprot:gene26227-32771_t